MPLRIAGPLCGAELGADWIDRDTLARTRTYAPSDLLAGTTEPSPARWAPTVMRRSTTASEIERSIRKMLDDERITDTSERAMFLAQTAHESAGFTRLRENLRYTPAGLLRVFPRKFRNLADARSVVAKGADAIAERIYSGARLGNTHPGDGAKYIGRGLIQLTGRANYEAAGKALKLDLVGYPELAEDPAIAARIALWYWRSRVISREARMGDVEGATRKINTALEGLADRRRRFQYYLSDPNVPYAPPASAASAPPAPATPRTTLP